MTDAYHERSLADAHQGTRSTQPHPPVPLGTAFTAGLKAATTCYERALAEFEKHGRRAQHLVRQVRSRATTAIDLLYSLLVIVGAPGLFIEEKARGVDTYKLVEAFNAKTALLLKSVRTLDDKTFIMQVVREFGSQAGWRMCEYCAKVLPPSVDDKLCPPPARCRKGFRNRRDYIRRSSPRG